MNRSDLSSPLVPRPPRAPQGRLRAFVTGLVLLAALAAPHRAAAQVGASSIVGIVNDSTGAPLPGVAVEASSPALIERVKVAVTNASGSFQIVDLRPGEYHVRFTLAGFSERRYTNIQLQASFTATLNATLSVGDVSEAVTVVGGAPVVDVRSNTSERALTQQVLESIPVGRVPAVTVLLMPGATTNRPDVGGSEAGNVTSVSIHGSSTRDITWNTDGLDMTSNTGAGGVTGQYPNQGAIQEISVQTKALPAAISGGGVNVNIISKNGGNQLHADGLASFTNHSLQSSNVSAEQRARGLTAPSGTDQAYDLNVNVGGPVRADRLWFFGSARRWRADRVEANSLDPDGTQSLDENLIWNLTGKVTWQANASTRISGFVDYNDKMRDHRRERAAAYQFVAKEASYASPLWGPVTNVKVTSVLRPTLLLDAGLSWYHVPWSLDYQPDLPADAFARNDIALSTLTGAPAPSMTRAVQERRTWSAIGTWLPTWHGAHNIQFGVQLSETPYGQSYDSRGHGDFIARYRNGVPDSVLVYNTPIDTSIDETDLGLFVQDSWAIGRYLTINAGARFERFSGRVNAQSAPAGQFVGPRDLAPVEDLVDWTTVVPRLAVSYNLFGDGRTAIKANASKYMQRQGSALITGLNPMRLNTEARTWNDANGDLIPQLSEIGPSLGTLERGANVRVDPDLERPNQWEYTVSLEHQLAENLGVTVSYYYRRYSSLTSTLNVALGAADYLPVTITNPLDGSPFTIYNQDPATRGRVDNLFTNADTLSSRYNGFEVSVDRRFSKGSLISGGVTIGANKGCYAASTNPNDLINACGYDPLDSKYLVNVSGLQRLPYGIDASAHLFHATGQPLSRTYTVTTAIVPGLTQVSQNIILSPAGDNRKPSQTLLDLRVGRAFRLPGGPRIEPALDLYNLLNENASLEEVQQVGPSLGRISRNVDGRTVRLGVKVVF